MRRVTVIGLLVLVVVAGVISDSRQQVVDLVVAATPWTTSDRPEPGDAASVGGSSDGADDGGEVAAAEPGASSQEATSATDARTDAPTARAPDTSGPPADLEISDDLPIPPLAPGVGTSNGGVARPATPTGPHWVPFKGNRILWCVYRGAGRCDGHHSYPAIDVDMKPGTPVYAAGPGTVYVSCNRGSACGGYGNHVRIRHLNNIRSVYGHFTRTVVRQGQTVRTGTLLGYSGCTGHCNGAHLHYEERNAADQSIHIGQMQGYSGTRVVTYPNVWGYRSWTGIPPDRLRIRNDFYPEDDRDEDGTLDRNERCVSAPGPTWTDGCPLPRRAPESGDAAVADGVGNLHVNAATADGAVWQLSGYARGWAWSDRGTPGAGAEIGGVVSTRATGGIGWVVAIDRDGSLWSGRAPQGAWQWAEIGRQSGGFTGTPAVAAGADGTVVVHATDVAGSLWRAVHNPEFGWEWSDLGVRGGGFVGSTPTSYFTGENDTITAIAGANGRLHLFTRSAAGQSQVRDVVVPGGGATTARPSIITDRAGLENVFVIGRNGHLLRYLRAYNGSWVWIDHGAVPGGDGHRGLTAWRTTGQDIGVAMVDQAGRIRVTTQTGTLTFMWRDLGVAGPLAGLGSIASGVNGNGTPQILLTAPGGVQRFVASGSWPRANHPTTGPPVG